MKDDTSQKRKSLHDVLDRQIPSKKVSRWKRRAREELDVIQTALSTILVILLWIVVAVICSAIGSAIGAWLLCRLLELISE